MSSSENKTLVLNSEFKEMDRLEPFLDDLQDWAGFGEEDYSRIMLTLSEAVNNAMVHGNGEDSRKKVTVVSSLEKADDQKVLHISVEDEGEGFDPDEIPDPLKDENLMNTGGRGVYLIEQYADKIKFSKEGTKITITFRLEN